MEGVENCSRRCFLRRALAGSAAAGLAWDLSAASTPSLSAAAAEPFIIDTHTHFYDPSRPQGVPWPPKNEERLYRTVLPKDYQALSKPAPVAGTVVVEASPWVEDNQWTLDLAKENRLITGLVGQLPVGTPECAALVKRFAANPLFRGLRIRPAPSRDQWRSQALTADLKRLADHDLSLDLVGGPEILEMAALLAREVPSLRIVIDHLAGVRVDGREPAAEWRQTMQSLAAHRNIFIKVSGLVEGTGRHDGQAPTDPAYYRPTLDAIWDLFGEDRLVYGSNWPVSELYAPLAVVQRIALEYFTAKGPKVVEKVFAQNAERAYRWVRR
jgi:L-fuconolactonase